MHDLIYCFRMLRKRPSFTLVAVLTLALAIGASTALFSIVTVVVLNPFSYKDPSRLFFVRQSLPKLGVQDQLRASVTQRTQEIGIRMALGARAGDVLRLVLGQFMRLTVVGVVLGLIGAYAATRLMTSLLFGVTPTDIMTFVLVPIGLSLVALVACIIPARRAARVDPLVALRYE